MNTTPADLLAAAKEVLSSHDPACDHIWNAHRQCQWCHRDRRDVYVDQLARHILAEPFEPIELEKRALVTMPGGWRMDQMKAEQPATTYAEFKREILNEIARCLNMPANIARADSSGYNYASGRLDHQTYFKAIRVEQSQLESVVLDRILAAWLDEAALIPGLLPDGLPPITEWGFRAR